MTQEYSGVLIDFDFLNSLGEKSIECMNKIFESRWEEGSEIIEGNILDYKYDTEDPYGYDNESNEDDFYTKKFKETLVKSPIKMVEGMEDFIYSTDDFMKKLKDAISSIDEDEEEVDDENNDNKNDGKVYINPFVTAKDKAKRDKTKYVEEHDDYIFEYDWNILSYDNYNTPDQDPLTYDYDFDLNKYKGVRGVFTDLGVEEEYEEQGESFHSSYELVDIKFLPKAYRYAHGITYTEAENRLMMIYEATHAMIGTMSRPEYCPVEKIIDENPAINYIQNHIDKYNYYIEFCNKFKLKPEWRDVHRHYGVWFKEPIITYQIWEEWFETEEDLKIPLLESLLSGAYFDYKREEVEDIQSRLTPNDKIVRAYYRHKDIYPVDDEYYSRYIPEDDSYEAVIGYDPSDGAVLRHDLQFDRILSETEEYTSQSELDLSDYCKFDDLVDSCLDDLSNTNEYEEEIRKAEREAEEQKPFEKLEEKLNFYRNTESKKLYDENNVKDADYAGKAVLLSQILSESDRVVEVETRPILEIVCDKAYRPSVELDTLDFNTKFKSFDDCETFDELVAWRKSKFDSRAEDIIEAIRKQTGDIFYNEITRSGFGNVDPERKALWNELYDETDDDEFPPIEYGLTLTDTDHIDGFINMDVSSIFEPVMEAGKRTPESIEEFNDNMNFLRKGSELLCKDGEREREKIVQYNEQEKESLGMSVDDNSYMHPKTAEKEGEEFMQMMELKRASNDDAFRKYLDE